jgi:hypothetical protein
MLLWQLMGGRSGCAHAYGCRFAAVLMKILSLTVSTRGWLWFGSVVVLATSLCFAAVYVTPHVVVQFESLLPTRTEDAGRPRVGDPAADFTLRDLAGREFRLNDSLGRRPIVLEFVSIT